MGYQTADGTALMLSASAASNGWRRIAKMGNAGTALVFPLNNLAPGTYYWSVQAIGAAFAGSSFATNTTFTVFQSPIAIPDAISTPTNTPLSFPASNIAANDIDLAGLPLAIVSVATNSIRGGQISFASGMITYTSPANFNGNDTFRYTVSNGQTKPSSGTVTATPGDISTWAGCSRSSCASPRSKCRSCRRIYTVHTLEGTGFGVDAGV